MESIKAISQEIDIMQMQDLSPEKEQYLQALNLCYDILARTEFVKKQTVVIDDESFTESNEPETHQVYGISSNLLADYIISIMPFVNTAQEEKKWNEFYKDLD